MDNKSIYTIGFTQKSAEKFYSLIENAGVTLVVDVRLNNTSQLAGFSKYPDVEYFLRKICHCRYVSDKQFSPEEMTLKSYKGKKIDWDEYVRQFDCTLAKREIDTYIVEKYTSTVKSEKVCFLCSEDFPDFCHRRLIAERFARIFDIEITHLI